MTEAPLGSKREQSLMTKRKEKLRNDLLARFGIGAIDHIDRLISRYANSMLSRLAYASVVEKLAEYILRPEAEQQEVISAPPIRTPGNVSPQPYNDPYPQKTPIVYTDQQNSSAAGPNLSKPLQAEEQMRKTPVINVLPPGKKDWAALARRNDEMGIAQIEQEIAEEAVKKQLYKLVSFHPFRRYCILIQLIIGKNLTGRANWRQCEDNRRQLKKKTWNNSLLLSRPHLLKRN